jgi:demethylmenaquinone methyltransferase/2-methoxy-6-polyprenyl-1,4-benzoquinol methylase
MAMAIGPSGGRILYNGRRGGDRVAQMQDRKLAPHPVLEKYYGREAARQSFVTALFDAAAERYDRICGVGSFGSGQVYRRQVLERAGLRQGMRLLDVATGTGLVARSALGILEEPRAVIGIDPSAGMLRQARKTVSGCLVQGRAEALPFRDDRFDMLSIGYALRHVPDLEVTFRECLRVLKPGGRLLILEISRPRSAVVRQLVRLHLQRILPLVMRLVRGGPHATLLLRYYWDTIAECVPPDTVLEVMRRSGFAAVNRRVYVGAFSEYVGDKPRS